MDRENVPGVDRFTTYGYDQVGNVLSMADTSRDGTDNQCFRYDTLQRLTEAWAQGAAGCATAPSASLLGGPAPYWQSYTYNPDGSRATEKDHDATGNTNLDVAKAYTYPGASQSRPHSLTQVDTTGPNGGTGQDVYTYDDAGNTTIRDVGGDSQTMQWDVEGHLASIKDASGTTSYLYDPDGSRLIQRTPTHTTLYLGGAEITLAKGAVKSTVTRYIDLGGGSAAVHADDGKVSFVVPDHQGTGQLAIDAATLSMRQRRTTPFGQVRGTAPTAWPGDKGFVGGTEDATGLTHLGAREYDPDTGRFISVDPLLNAGDPQSLNGYVYADNNPSRFSDPAGTEVGSKPNSCQYDLKYCTPEVQQQVGYNPNTGTATPPPPPQPTPEQQIQAWIKQMTPSSNADGQLMSWWSGYTGLNTTGPYWEPTINGVGNLCFGLLGCKKAYDFLQSHDGSKANVAKAKKIAATYCVDHLPDCQHDAAGYQLSLELWGSVQDIILAREGLKKGGPCSFTGETPVLLEDGTTKPIDAIENGDKVEAADPGDGKHRGGRRVAATHINRDADLVDVTIRAADGSTYTVHTTANHPFWDDTTRTWTSAGTLTPGHTLNTATDQHVFIFSIHRVLSPSEDMYNLTVDGLHTYYVLAGSTPVLVHNSGGDDGLVTVGRWMSTDEYQKMMATGMVQPGAGDRTFVVYPASKDAYISARPGSVYVEFDVPQSQLSPGGRPGDYKLSGPGSLDARLAARKGLPAPELPAAKNIQLGGSPGCS